jgi:predicted AlkP superfamily phosphohydrolase/phosphomutase
MSARVLFVGLDSADPVLLTRFEEEGLVPTIAGLRREGGTFDLANGLGTLAGDGGIWPEIWRGRSASRTGLYCPYYQFCSGEAEPRPRGMREFDPRAFWTEAGDAGMRVAVVDVPLAIPVAGLNGVQLIQWGTHDRPYVDCQEPVGEPQELVDEIRQRYGVHPLLGKPWKRPPLGAACDGHGGTLEELERLLDDLVTGLELSSTIRLDILGRESWDLFACGLGEYQCVGHHFWDFEENPAHPRLHRAVRDVYARLDEAIGALVHAAGREATTIVLASHGHGPHTGGGQLLSEVLARLGMGSRQGPAASARRWIPAPLWDLARRIAPGGVKTKVHPPLFDSPSARAMAVSVDRNAWVRLNLKGREPNGSVGPGAEAEALVEELREELLLLEQPENGERIVADVVSADALGADVHPDVPDLIVVFREDLGLIERCHSPRVGLVERAFPVAGHRRSSHPLGNSRLWIRGPGIAAGTEGTGNVLDVAPCALRLLGVPVPPWMEGHPLPGIVDLRSERPARPSSATEPASGSV